MTRLRLSLALLACAYAGTLQAASRTVVVSPAASNLPADNGALLIAALNSVTGTQASPWVIKVDAGIFDIGAATLVMKQFVDIEGSGELSTTIQGNGFAAAPGADRILIQGTSMAELRGLTVKGLQATTVEFLVGEKPSISHAQMNHVTVGGGKGVVAAAGGQIFILNSTLSRVTSSGADASSNMSYLRLQHVHLTTQTDAAITADGALVDIDDVRILPLLPLAATVTAGVVTNSGSIFFLNSIVNGDVHVDASSQVHFGGSFLLNSLLDGPSGTLTCLETYGVAPAVLNVNCQ